MIKEEKRKLTTNKSEKDKNKPNYITIKSTNRNDNIKSED